MIYLKLISVLLFAFSFETIACELINPIRHTNPDGTQGGLVSRNAKVSATVYIGFNARVCDRAWADGNARILDYATIKEDAWIREYSVIKDRATVAGRAIVWGTRNTPAEVGEDSKIYGEAKIMTGTKVSGRAEVYGTVTLEDSNVTGTAKVCEGYIITYQDIVDDYFCLETESESRISVYTSNVSENKFNRRPRWIEFKTSAFNFSRDPNVYIVTINGTQIHPENIDARGSFLRVENIEALVDGVNEITLSGRDEYGKKISEKQFSIFIGSNSKTITLNPVPSTSMKFVLDYEYKGESYTGDFRVTNGEIVLQGLPNDLRDISIKLKAVGTDGFIAASFSDINQLPELLSVSKFPGFKSNVLNFSRGLSDWEISHPENVNLIEDVNGRHISISAHETEVVELAKTVSLSSKDKALNVNFDLPAAFIAKSFNKNVQIVLVNKEEKNIQFYEYSPLTSYKNKSSSGLVNLQIGKRYNGQFISVFFRVLPSSQTNSITQSALNVFEGSILNKFIDFKAKDLAIKNKQTNALYPSSSGDNVACGNSQFDLKTSQFEIRSGDLNSFSAGSFLNMPLIEGNRIFGSLDILRGDDSKVKSVELIGVQNGVEKFSTSLARCANNSIGENRKTDVHLQYTENIVKYLFEVPRWMLANVDIGVGAEILLKIRVTFEDDHGNTLTLERSNTDRENVEKSLAVLRAPHLGVTFNYSGNDSLPEDSADYNADGVDNYDSPTKNYNRTGGDKWIKPAYSGTFTSIMNIFAPSPATPRWQVNDMGKMNGGPFLGHTEHHSGLDADIQFKEFDPGSGKVVFDFGQLGNDPTRWKSVLNELDDFLKGIKDYYKFIRNIYVSREFNQNSAIYLNNRFENRCYNGRYINFNSKWGSGTLLRDVVGHHNHFHLSFLPTDELGSQNEIDLSVTDLEEFNLDDFYYSLNPDATILTVEPIKPADFKTDTKVFWRYQDSDDFSNTEMTATFGRWPAPPKKDGKQLLRIEFNKNSTIRYIYLAIAKENGDPLSMGSADQSGKTRYQNGACIERSVAIDLGEKMQGKRWRFRRIGNKFVKELL